MSNPEDDLTDEEIQRMTNAVHNIGRGKNTIPVESRTASSRPRSVLNKPYEPVTLTARPPRYETERAPDGRWTVIKIEGKKRTKLHSYPSQTSAWDYIESLKRNRL